MEQCSNQLNHPARDKLTLFKGDILLYCQGLIELVEENAKLVTTAFHYKLPGEKDFKDHGLTPGDFIYWEEHQIKNTLQPHWKGPYQAPNLESTTTLVYRNQTPGGQEAADISGGQLSQDIDKARTPMGWYETESPFCLLVLSTEK